MQLVIEPSGTVRCLYGETISLSSLGPLRISRGSYVEPTEAGEWQADLSPLLGPLLGPFFCRSEALDAERQWLEANWLSRS